MPADAIFFFVSFFPFFDSRTFSNLFQIVFAAEVETCWLITVFIKNKERV